MKHTLTASATTHNGRVVSVYIEYRKSPLQPLRSCYAVYCATQSLCKTLTQPPEYFGSRCNRELAIAYVEKIVGVTLPEGVK